MKKIIFTILAFTLSSIQSSAQKGSGCPDDLLPLLSPNNNWGYVNLIGEWVIEPIYAKVSPFVEGKAVVQKGAYVGVVDCDGNVFLQPIYDRLTNVRNGKVWAMYKGKWGLLGRKGSIFQAHQFDNIIPIINTDYSWVKKNNLWSLFDESKNKITTTEQFDMIQVISASVTLVGKNKMYGVVQNSDGKLLIPIEIEHVKKVGTHNILFEQMQLWGMFNSQGKILINPQFQEIELKENVLIVNKDGQYGLYSLYGKELTKNYFEKIGEYGNGLFLIKSKGKYGYCSKFGKVYIKPTYDEAKPFVSNYAVVQKNSKYGIIDIKNKFIVPLKYDAINPSYINNAINYYEFKNTEKSYLFNTNFEQVLDEAFDQISLNEPSEFIRLKNENKTKYYNILHKKWVSDLAFEEANPFNENYAIVSSNGKRGVLGSNGNMILDFKYDFISKDMFMNKRVFRTVNNKKEGITDFDGKVIIDNIYDQIIPALPNYLKVRINNLWGIVKTNGQEIIPPTYPFMSHLGNDPKCPQWPAIVSLKEKKGMINEKGEVVYPTKCKDIKYVGEQLYFIVEGKKHLLTKYNGTPIELKYSDVGYFGDGLLAVYNGKNWGYINSNGDEKIECTYDAVDIFYQHYAAVKKNEKWGIINRQNKWIVNPEYDNYFLNKDGDRVFILNGKSFVLNISGTLIEKK